MWIVIYMFEWKNPGMPPCPISDARLEQEAHGVPLTNDEIDLWLAWMQTCISILQLRIAMVDSLRREPRMVLPTADPATMN